MASPAKRKRATESATQLDFSKPWKSSDVILLVENQKFHVHRNVLALWSPVFETMFTSNFSEKKKREIRLPGKKAASVKSFLLMIYPPGKEEVTAENWNAILDLAHEYQIKSILDKCEDVMVDLLNNDELDCISTLIWAQNYDLERVADACIINYPSSSLEELKEHELFDQIEPQNYALILERMIKMKERAQEKSLTQESLKVIKKRGLKKVEDISKLFLKHVSHKSSIDCRDVNVVAKDDAIEAFSLALKLDNRPHSCPEMDNVVCPDMSAVLQLMKQLKGTIESII